MTKLQGHFCDLLLPKEGVQWLFEISRRDRKVLKFSTDGGPHLGGALAGQLSKQPLPELSSLGLGAPSNLVLRVRDQSSPSGRGHVRNKGSQRGPGARGSRGAEWGGGAAFSPGSSLLSASSASSILSKRPGGRLHQLH